MSTLTILLQASAQISQLAAAFAAAIAVIGAAYGISKIASHAMESIARQPEAASDIRSNMIVSAALIEGVAFFAIVICLLILFV